MADSNDPKADAEVWRKNLDKRIATTPLFQKMLAMFAELSAEEQMQTLFLSMFDNAFDIDQLSKMVNKLTAKKEGG